MYVYHGGLFMLLEDRFWIKLNQSKFAYTADKPHKVTVLDLISACLVKNNLHDCKIMAVVLLFVFCHQSIYLKSNLMVKETFRTRVSRSSRTPYYALIGFMIRH